jgi:hypothetical protein
MTGAVALLVLLLRVAGQASNAPVNTYWPKGHTYNYKVAYAIMPEKECDSALTDQIEVPFKDVLVDGVPLYIHQCAYKCTKGCSADTAKDVTGKDGVKYSIERCGCTDYDSSTDTADVFTVCGNFGSMKGMCDALPDCFGIHKYIGISKGFLLKKPCMLEALEGLDDSTVFDYYAKMDPESAGGEGCPMGMAVLADGFKDLASSCPELSVKEQYNPLSADTFGTSCGKITWSPNGCGWLVQAPPPPAPPTTPPVTVCPFSTCVDKVPEANWIFGFEGAEYDPEICKRTEPWLAAPGYCQNALWKALCPEQCPEVECYGRVDSCEAWMDDNDAAADVLTSMLTIDGSAGSCEALKAENMCEDPVVKVVCLATCPMGVRRLTEATEAHLESMRHVYGTHFREQLKVLEQEVMESGGRRLDAHPLTLFGSWDPTVRPTICADTSESSQSPPDYESISTADMWDWYTWLNTKHDIDITPSCPLQDTYLTGSGKYCDTNNMNVMGIYPHIDITSADPGDAELVTEDGAYKGKTLKELKTDIVGDLCWKKCLAPDTSGTAATDPLCAGTDPAFNAYSNALCIERDTCETYCDALGGMCTGFEMHKTVPRCYLITDACTDTIGSDIYDQVLKAQGLTRYKTYADMTCDIRNFAVSTMTGPREACEEYCNGVKSCSGFAFTEATSLCEFAAIPGGTFRAAGYCSGGGMTYADQYPTDDKLKAEVGTDYVEKILAGFSIEQPWSPACSAVITAPPGILPGTATGTYARTEAASCGAPAQDVVCYMSPTGMYRIIWGNQALFSADPNLLIFDGMNGLHRQCSGWVLEYLVDGSFVPMYATYLGETIDCPTEPPTYSLNSPDGYAGMYSWKPTIDEEVDMNFVCKSYPTCGTLQTCVLAKNRFFTEAEIMLTKGSVSVDPYKFLSDTPGYETLLDPVTFRPKTLISVKIAKLFVSKVKEQYGKELYRNVPGHLRIKIADLGADVTTAIITMISSGTTYGSGFTLTENGQQYAIPEQSTDPIGYEPWYTDIVRLEKFDKDGKVIEEGAPTVIDFYAPTSPNLMVVVFDKTTGQPIDRLYATMVPGSPGYWRVSATKSADYAGTSESPCPATPPTIPNAAMDGVTCPELDAGAICPVTCAPTYMPAGGEGSGLICQLGKWRAPDGVGGLSSVCVQPPDYEAETQLFRLSHRSRLDYGWRIRKVEAFTDAACSKAINTKDMEYVGPSDSYMNSYPGIDSKDSILSRKLADEGNCLKSATACKDFWSFGLNVNPYTVDETHGAAAYVEFTVAAGQSVQCVQVTSRTKTGDQSDPTPRQYYPANMTLHRGFYADEAAGEEPVEYSMISKKGWTMMWTASADTEGVGASSVLEKEGLVTTFRTACGTPDSRIFGELLKYVPAVPSPCHCKQLCIDEIDSGCVSWNYKVASQECYLQSTIKAVPTESCESFIGYTSGTTDLRVEDTSPKTVTPGAAFTLTVTGTNLPTEESAVIQKTTPPRQRVKIVDEGDVCAESEVASFVEGIGCSHPYFCAPKPSATDATTASWSGLKIFAADKDKVYTVCYNRGLTYDRYEWFPIGKVTVPKTPFSFTTEPKLVKRTTPTFSLTVERPPMVEYSSPDDWTIKLVKSYFDCSKLSDAKIGINLTLAEGTVDTVTFPGISVYDTASLTFADVGLYKVCFAKDGTNYEQIPSKEGGVYFEIVAVEGDSSHPRSVYSYQTLSGKVGESNTFTLKGNKLYLPSDSGIAFFSNSSCSGASVFMATVDEAKSTADGYVFTADIAADVAAGEYTACYCDDQEDSVATGNATGKSDKYTVTQDYVCDDGLGYGSLTAAAKEDVCTVKCARGCTGADCYCDFFDTADYVPVLMENTSYPLCVSAPKCKEYCSAMDSCTGFDYDPAKNMCTILKGACDALTFAEGSEFFDRTGNSSVCDLIGDFDAEIGKVTLSAKADIGVDWVLTPGETASIEVIGSNLNWQTDRLMVIDCTGICGISGPTASVMTGPKSQMQFNHWVAVMPDFDDPPSDDYEVPGSYVAPVKPAKVYWRYVEKSYCAGNNMDILAIPDVKRHQCFDKCAGGTTCVGDDCFCTGLMQGYDTKDSSALCLDETGCKNACAGLDDCFGFDMHTSLPRCFLNSMTPAATDTMSCEEYVVNGKLTPFPTYKLVYKQHTPTTRRAEAAPSEEAATRSLLPAIDQGKSWNQILRFNDISFKTGGKFKACFCDPDTLAAGKYCKKAADYKIDIGTIHVSGVSCLVEDPKFQRGTCVEQFQHIAGTHGGLRCYPGAAPTITVPVVPEKVVPNEDAAAPAPFNPALSSFCLYGPEEETRDDPLCNL